MDRVIQQGTEVDYSRYLTTGKNTGAGIFVAPVFGLVSGTGRTQYTDWVTYHWDTNAGFIQVYAGFG